MKIAIKIVLVLVLLQSSIGLVHAENGTPKHAGPNDGSAEFLLYNHRPSHNKDSVYVTYDRCDRSGAGIVREVFYPKKNHTISINAIPAGKYFVTIQFLGTHHDRFEKVVKIRPSQCKSIELELQTRDEFTKAGVRIPSSKVDFSNLAIVTMK
jgi:hypothetical protein